MDEKLDPLLKKLPPTTIGAMTKAVNRCAEKLEMDPVWVQRWIGFTVVGDALARYPGDGGPLFEFKGGAAIELRLRQGRFVASGDSADAAVVPQPRTTKDLDATYHGSLDEAVLAVERALTAALYGFSFRVIVETPNAPHMRRISVRVNYNGASLSRVQLEVSAYEGTRLPPDHVPAFSLKPFGIDGPANLPCIPLAKQIAQKFHAVTEVPAQGAANDRFRDLVDLVLLSALVPASPELRAVCEETFQVRNWHAWPPTIVIYPSWREPLEALASSQQIAPRRPDEIVEFVTKYMNQIASS